MRVEAEVGPGEVERRVTQAAKVLARNIRVPGFRAGKAGVDLSLGGVVPLFTGRGSDFGEHCSDRLPPRVVAIHVPVLAIGEEGAPLLQRGV